MLMLDYFRALFVSTACFRAFGRGDPRCSISRTIEPATAARYSSIIPNIDVCGFSSTAEQSCQGVGTEGYFYRCCSPSGHCGPKNDLQDPAQYCGSSCQRGFGDCTFRSIPQRPSTPPVINNSPGGTCGPIVNQRCQSSECCSGSNFCGSGPDFCGSVNWCQPEYGRCD